jgi:hypothetical protein
MSTIDCRLSTISKLGELRIFAVLIHKSRIYTDSRKLSGYELLTEHRLPNAIHPTKQTSNSRLPFFGL